MPAFQARAGEAAPAFLLLIAAILAVAATAVLAAPPTRATALAPESALAGLAAAVGVAGALRGHRRVLIGGTVTAILLALWLSPAAHWVETSIRVASGPCPPFRFCQTQPPLTEEETGALAGTAALGMAAAAAAALALIFRLARSSGRPGHPNAALALAAGAALACAGAMVPWIVGGPPFGYDDRPSFFTPMLAMAAVAGFAAAAAAWSGRSHGAALGAVAALALALYAAGGLPFTEWFITVNGQQPPYPCLTAECDPPAFTALEETARWWMLGLGAGAAVAAGAGLGLLIRRAWPGGSSVSVTPGGGTSAPGTRRT